MTPESGDKVEIKINGKTEKGILLEYSEKLPGKTVFTPERNRKRFAAAVSDDCSEKPRGFDVDPAGCADAPFENEDV